MHNSATTVITDSDVIWDMHWDQSQFPDKPAVEVCFEEQKAIARLLAEDVLIVNTNWWEENWPEDAKQAFSLSVICNDVFAWGCADAEKIHYDEIQTVYEAWLGDRRWGPIKWCCIKRNEQPQTPVANSMKKDGVWDSAMESLPPNEYDKKIKKDE